MKSKNSKKTLRNLRARLANAVVDIKQSKNVMGGYDPWLDEPGG